MFIQKKVRIKLEGCLEEKVTSKICDHGNHEDSCLLCEKEQEKKNLQQALKKGNKEMKKN